jgi:protein-tyrosine phosphatase
MTPPRSHLRPSGLVDLHTHLLPGVDDGVRDMAEALDQLRDAAAQGIEALVCTPHMHPASREQRDRLLAERQRIFERLVETAQVEGGLPELGLGSEVLVLDQSVSFEHPGLRLNGTAYALLEVLFWREDFSDLRELFQDLLDEGYRPVLAHVERYAHLPRQGDLLALWREDGVLAQVNASSFAGHHGEGVRERAWRLLEAGDVDLIASDVHGVHMRLNYMAEAYASVSEGAGEEAARRLFSDVPRAIFEGAPALPR